MQAKLNNAGVVRRAIAAAIDYCFFAIIFSVVFVLLGNTNLPGDELVGDTYSILILGLVWFLYFPLMESSLNDATIGQRIAGIRVFTNDGGRPNVGKSVLRHIGALLGLAAFGMGHLYALFNNRRETLHDKLCGCTAIHVHPFSLSYLVDRVITLSFMGGLLVLALSFTGYGPSVGEFYSTLTEWMEERSLDIEELGDKVRHSHPAVASREQQPSRQRAGDLEYWKETPRARPTSSDVGFSF